MSDDNRRIFEQSYGATRYATTAGDDVFAGCVRERLAPLLALPKGQVILDLGCGTGSFTLPLARAGHTVVAADFSGTILRRLQGAVREGDLGDRVRCIEADATRLPLADRTFDVVISFAVLYAVPDLELALREIGRVLKPEGRAWIDLGNADSLNAIEADRVETRLATRHVNVDAMHPMLAAAGLEIVGERCFQVFPCWGGSTERAREQLNPLLARLLGGTTDSGELLDERIASGALAREFAFRHVLALRSSASQARRIGYALPGLDAEQVAAWFAPAREAVRARAHALAARGRYREAAQILVAALREAPDDFASVVALADLFDGDEERALTARMRERLDVHRPAHATGVPAALAGPGQAPARPRAPLEDRSGAPAISVVLPTFDQIAWLPRAVESVLDQTRGDFELIVVDDGSTDGTAPWLATVDDPRVRVLRQDNAGLPAALERGFAAARGALWTWTSSDNVCAPDMLEKLAAALEAHPEAGLAVGGFEWIDAEDRVLRRTVDQDLAYRSMLCRNPGIAGFLYRADLARAVGGYERELEGAEDWDMWLRLVERAPAVLVRDVIYRYREHAASMTATRGEQIRKASCRVFRRGLQRAGESLELERLYPALWSCSDPESAAAEACFDFGTRLLQSPFCDPALARRFFDHALALRPDLVAATCNRAVALAREGRLEAARAALARLASGARGVAATAAAIARDGARTMPVLSLDPEVELFRRERRLVHDGSSAARV